MYSERLLVVVSVQLQDLNLHPLVDQCVTIFDLSVRVPLDVACSHMFPSFFIEAASLA